MGDAADRLRATLPELEMRGQIALYAFAAELALDTLPPGEWREDGYWANSLAVRVAVGEDLDCGALVAALEDAEAGNRGPLLYHSETEGTVAENVWGVAASLRRVPLPRANARPGGDARSQESRRTRSERNGIQGRCPWRGSGRPPHLQNPLTRLVTSTLPRPVARS